MVHYFSIYDLALYMMDIALDSSSCVLLEQGGFGPVGCAVVLVEVEAGATQEIEHASED